MTNLGRLLSEKAPAKKPASGAVTVTVKTGSGGSPAAGDKNKKKNKKSSAAGQQKSQGKMLRDLLQHHDSASVYHRQKAAEHGEYAQYHSKSRFMRHLGALHHKAREYHENLRHTYHKLSNATYNALRKGFSANQEKGAKKDKKK